MLKRKWKSKFVEEMSRNPEQTVALLNEARIMTQRQAQELN
jgi:uncharacterized protein YlzI (FlbEa/FlbD family)